MTTQLKEHPGDRHPTPPLPEQAQAPPGTESQMRPPADHGEETYRGTGRLTDRVALITGGDSGIGRAVAIAYAREGADVLISYLGGVEDEDARDTIRWIERAGRTGRSLAGDIGREEHCRAMIDLATEEFGRVDILVHNAAWHDCGDRLEEVTTEEWQRIFRTNIEAMFHLARAALPHMTEGGAIINTASVQAFTPSPTLLPYAATKGAIVTFTRALAQDPGVVERGVRVNAVAPGPIGTPLILSTIHGSVRPFGEKTTLGRPGQPAELAPLYVFLASREASSITGEVIGVSGGPSLS